MHEVEGVDVWEKMKMVKYVCMRKDGIVNGHDNDHKYMKGIIKYGG